MKSKSDSIVLFDLDGTLTPAREQMSAEMGKCLRKLSHLADIGIVTGSPMEYVREQAVPLWRPCLASAGVSIMPCNGTQLFTWKRSRKDYELASAVDMKDELKGRDYWKTVWTLLKLQAQTAEHYDIPLTGNFISYRGSMLNWCMIGRDASMEERAAFVKADKAQGIRETLSAELSDALDDLLVSDVTHALGGNTSIDIYPTGWDKTFALRHVDTSVNTYFVGDRCDPGGNDYALYNALPICRRFKTESPEETIRIIEDNIIPSLEGK
jgi:phosphomannomutase